jgi:hypothetical protein
MDNVYILVQIGVTNNDVPEALSLSQLGLPYTYIQSIRRLPYIQGIYTCILYDKINVIWLITYVDIRRYTAYIYTYRT